MEVINLNGQSLNIVNENVAKLKQLFPEIITEGKIDFDKLKAVLGEHIEKNDESYRFTWYGKRDALRKSQIPSTGTLRPCIEESKDWDTTQNLYIEGDNLEVLKLLQKSYNSRIKMIYIDPPYNKDKDFIYPDKWSDPIKVYKKITGQIDENGNITSSDTEDEGGKHTKWLNMMFPRLRLARNLLTDDGVIFISIDDDEQANLKKICDEVFGEENFITTIHVQMSTVQGQKVKAAKEGNIVKNAEYILVYSRNGAKNIGKRPLKDPVKYDNHYNKFLLKLTEDAFTEKNLVDVVYEDKEIMKELELLKIVKNGSRLTSNKLQDAYDISPKFKNWIIKNANNICRVHDSIAVPDNVINSMKSNIIVKYDTDSRSYLIGLNNNKGVSQRILLSEKINIADDFYNTLGPTTIRGDWWSGFYLDMGNVSKEGEVNYNNGKKPVRLIKQLINFVTGKNDMILDFFSGSATTAHAVLQLNSEDGGNRRFIMVQLPENLDELLKMADSSAKKDINSTINFLESIDKPHFISELGKYRIDKCGEKIKAELKEKYKEHQQKQQLMIENAEQAPMNPDDLDIGFKVFKLDYSNLKKWSVDVGEDFYKESKETQNAILSEMLGLEVDNFVEGRTELDVVYEIMLKYGLDLTYPIETYNFDGTNVYSIGYGGLIVCLDTNIEAELADKIVELIKELEPSMVRVAVRDLGFVSDAAKTNFKETLKNGVYAYFDGTDDKADKQNQFKFITI